MRVVQNKAGLKPGVMPIICSTGMIFAAGWMGLLAMRLISGPGGQQA